MKFAWGHCLSAKIFMSFLGLPRCNFTALRFPTGGGFQEAYTAFEERGLKAVVNDVLRRGKFS